MNLDTGLVESDQRLLRDRRYFFGRRAAFLYELMGRVFRNATDWRFMNYGYAPEGGAGLDLRPEDQAERYCAELYHLVASQADVTGLDVLDVGSGRGGGASLVHRYLGPRSTTGMDIAESAVAFCRKVHGGIEGLSYRQGDSMDMPFQDGSFDVVLNVESAHCYPDRQAFLAEVLRVLRPGGYFLHTDFTAVGARPDPGVIAAGFDEVGAHDITAGVVRALNLDHDRRHQLIHRRIPFGFRKLFGLWAGTRDSWIYDDFAAGRRRYIVCRARKPQ